MELEEIYFLSQVIAAFALVASLIFVGLQVRQSNRAAELSHAIERGNAQRQILDQTRTWHTIYAESEEKHAAIRKCLHDYSSGTPYQRAVFASWANRFLLLMEQAKFENLNTRIGDRFTRTMLTILKSPGGREWWEYYSVAASDDVRAYLEDRLARERDELPNLWDLSDHFAPEPGEGGEDALDFAKPD